MADSGDSLDILEILDELADDTVNRLVSELAPATASVRFGDAEALDMLSICDSTSPAAGGGTCTFAPCREQTTVDEKVSDALGKCSPEEKAGRGQENHLSSPDTTNVVAPNTALMTAVPPTAAERFPVVLQFQVQAAAPPVSSEGRCIIETESRKK